MVSKNSIGMLRSFEINRAATLMQQAIAKLDLKLDGLEVLTEAGTNSFIYTPLIAYFAGASKVYVWTKKSVYGDAEHIESQFNEILRALNVGSDIFQFAINERPEAHIQQADIITNLGFIRPLDKNFLKQIKKGAVVSYMCEAWEIRSEDVDIAFCKKNNIPVAGVWENHPELMIFNGCGALSVKLCMEAGFEVYQNRILVVSSDKFGKTAADSFRSLGAADVQITDPGSLNDINLSAFDFIFVADYTFGDEIIGENIRDQLNTNSKPAIIHLCGAVNYSWLKEQEIYCYPAQQGFSSRMTKTLAHLGLKPLIDLHTAGLKVGELLFKNKNSELIQEI